jgi:hypothetical protein
MFMEPRSRRSELIAEQLVSRARVFRTMAAGTATPIKDELILLANRFEGLAAREIGLRVWAALARDDQ